MRFAVTGLSGFVGQAVLAAARAGAFGQEWKLLDLYHAHPTLVGPAAAPLNLADPLARTEALAALRRWRPEAVLHLAANSHVDACERERGDRSGPAWQVNAVAPVELWRAAAECGAYFLHVSTDYVFSGGEGPYRESDAIGPAVNWYGATKEAGERALVEAGAICTGADIGASPAAIARPSLPYGPPHPRKNDLVRSIRAQLESGQQCLATTDQLTTPTHVDDVAAALLALVVQRRGGIYHLSGATVLTPYDAALAIALVFGFPRDQIVPATLDELTSARGRAPRPRHPALLRPGTDAVLAETGLRMAGFVEGLLRERQRRPAASP